MDNNYNVINKLYNKAGFLDKYGGSLWGTFIISLIFFLAISYYYIYNNIDPIKADWVNQRCKPSVMPFAGLINPPPPEKMSAFEFTQHNFSNCIQSILGDIIGIFLAPFYYLIHVLTNTFEIIDKGIQSIRQLLNSIRNSVSDISIEIMGRILNFLIPLQQLIIKVKDTMHKSQGVMSASIYTLLGTYDTLMSVVKSIVKIIASILISLASIIIVLFIIPFGLGMPAAVPLIVIFIMILVPGIMVYIVQVLILKQMTNPLPNIPHCFCENTKLKLINNEEIEIKNCQPGMVLENDNIITSVLELVNIDETFYNLNGVICSGEHNVKIENNFVTFKNNWIKVKNHPDSVKLDNHYNYIYCINTSKKYIKINNIIFSDWDNLDELQLNEIKEKCKDNYLPPNFNSSDIHKYLDGGFIENTQIKLQNGNDINIKDIKLNDILSHGERVVGLVKINAQDLNIMKYKIQNGSYIIGGPNINICNNTLGLVINTLNMDGINNNMCDKYIYNLITDKYTFYVNGIRYYDYNSCIDIFLDLEKYRLLKAII